MSAPSHARSTPPFRWLVWAAFGLLGMPVAGLSQSTDRINPMVTLHERGLPVFGLYAPGARSRGPDGEVTVKSPAERAAETVAFEASDFVFEGGMERGVERELPAFLDYVNALGLAGAGTRNHPLVVKTPRIADDPAAAARNIQRQLDAGVSTVMFVGVESADEVRQGLAAMRFESVGGTRPDDSDVSAAAAYWGVTEEEYRRRAGLWPLDPGGELVAWVIVESRAGLENVREIAAVEGIGVLWPGAGTLRGLFTTRTPDGERVLDEAGWEASIQSVLAACGQFDVPCGYPANERDIVARLGQGFQVFVMGWGESGFRTVEIGRRASGR